MLLPCSCAHMADFLHFLPFSVFKPRTSWRIWKNSFCHSFTESLSPQRFVLQKDNFSKPYLPFFLPGQCCFLYYSTLARWLGILRNQFRQSLPQPAWHLHKETWHFVPHKGLPTFPRTEKDREYSWVRLLTTIKEHVGTKGFFFYNWLTFSCPGSSRRVTRNP